MKTGLGRLVERAPLRECHGRACPRRRDAPEDPAPCRACCPRRPHGAFRRLRHAGAIPRPASSTEHNWTREHAGLFDVSHMGQAFLIAGQEPRDGRAGARSAGSGRHREPEARPAALHAASDRRRRHPRRPDGDALGRPGTRTAADLVVNASMKDVDYAHIAARLPAGVTLIRAGRSRADRPAGAGRRGRAVRGMLPRRGRPAVHDVGATCRSTASTAISRRSGYTGEDGYEISVPAARCRATLAELLLAEPEVKPIGLGARDSLRLEAGPLPLRPRHRRRPRRPIEAGLDLVDPEAPPRGRRLSGRRRASSARSRTARARVRVGIKPEGRAPAREGADIATPDGREVGIVTSGGFGPSVNGPIAMGYVVEDASARRHGSASHRARQADAGQGRRRCRSSPHRYKR